MRVVQRDSNNGVDPTYLARLAEEYKKSKEALNSIEKRTNDLKKELSDIVDNAGVADNNGHLWLEVGDIKLKRERRVMKSFDSASAETWAKATNKWDDVKEVVEVLSEDKLLGLAWNDEEIAKQIQTFYIEKESWAFKA
jgi:hypothetical protein